MAGTSLWWTGLLDTLAAITLGQLWRAIYNPPTPTKLAIAAIALIYKAPEYYRRWCQWRLGRRVVTFDWPAPKEADEGWMGRVIERPNLFSHEGDTSLLPPEAGKTGSKRKYITCYDPSTAYHLTTLPLLSGEEIAQQMQRTSETFPTWRKTSFAQRKMLLRSLKDWVIRDMDSIVRVACRDTGKTRVDAAFGEILTTLAKIDWLIKHGEKALTRQQRPGNLLLSHKVSKVHYTPLGLTLACVSWNYSFHNLISPILASLFAGNPIIVKCSEQVAWSSMWFVGGVRACLRACGFDDEVIGLVVCLPDVADTVTRNPLVKHVTFIGSELVGRKVAAAAAEIMVPTCIELGGKDPALLLPSADVTEWASHLMRGVFQSAGQNCIGIELVLVHRSSYDKLISTLLPRIKALRLGTDVSSLISSTPIPKLESILSSATAAGAQILAGGRPHAHTTHAYGSYFEPTLVVGATMDMDIAKTELFAPVMSVVVYDEVDQAVEWLNASRFGLGASVYGNDKRMCRYVAGGLECGMVSINDFGVFYLNQAAPFGGVKASGHGRFGGEEGLRSLCYPKTVVEDRFFSLVRTRIPRVVDFPLPDPVMSWAFLKGLVGLAHGPSLLGRVQGLVQLVVATTKH